MESVFDMLRAWYLILFSAVIAFVIATEEGESPPKHLQSEVEGAPDGTVDDLEPDASYWGYGRPWRYYGGWGYGRGYGWGGWRGGYYGRGWGGRGWGGWGYWG